MRLFRLKNNFHWLLFGFILYLANIYSHSLEAQELIMGRSVQAFPEAMLTLQEQIQKQGYQLSVVQRVDVGLTGMGFQTDKYRVVFFGKTEEIKRLSARYPLLVPYLPLSIAIYAEEQETILVAMSPIFLQSYFSRAYPNDVQLSAILRRWDSDIRKIISASCEKD